MKTINKLFKGIFFCTLVSVSVSSCDLEVEPPANIAAETYWTSEKDAWYNLNSIYSDAIPGTLRQFVRKTCFCRKLEIVRWMNL